SDLFPVDPMFFENFSQRPFLSAQWYMSRQAVAFPMVAVEIERIFYGMKYSACFRHRPWKIVVVGSVIVRFVDSADSNPAFPPPRQQVLHGRSMKKIRELKQLPAFVDGADRLIRLVHYDSGRMKKVGIGVLPPGFAKNGNGICGQHVVCEKNC